MIAAIPLRLLIELPPENQTPKVTGVSFMQFMDHGVNSRAKTIFDDNKMRHIWRLS
jgi:hypothetical protein